MSDDEIIAERMMQVMSSQRFANWYEKFIEECIQERPTPAQHEKFRDKLAQMIKGVTI